MSESPSTDTPNVDVGELDEKLKQLDVAERAIDSAYSSGKADRTKVTRVAQANVAEAVKQVDEALAADEEADEALRISLIANRTGDREQAKRARARARQTRRHSIKEHDEATEAAKRAYHAIKFSSPNRLGFLRVIQVVCLLNMVETLALTVFMSRNTITYDFTHIMLWLDLVFDGVSFYLIWNRLAATKKVIIGFSVFNIVVETIWRVLGGAFTGPNALLHLGAHILSLSWYIVLIVYFLRSERVRLTLTRQVSHEVMDNAVEKNRHGWPFIRNLILYYCVFSTLGHWMESGFCYLVSLGLFAGDIDFNNTMLFRDWLYPFPMHGIAVVLVALILWPIRNALAKRFNPIVTLLLSFLINMAFCSGIELAGGLMFNANLQLWNYTDIPFNFMGQVCLQNAVGFGIAATLIVYVVYPFLERLIARVPNEVMNMICVVVFSIYAVLEALYVIDLSPEAAAANAPQAAQAAGSAAAGAGSAGTAS